MMESLPTDWRSILGGPSVAGSFRSLDGFLERERAEHEVYPAVNDVFAALRLTPFRSVRAVILGQDLYHRPGQAHGLAFSVPSGVAHPASLRTILRELETDLGRAVPADVSLERWARHGVLLLNVVLTVRRGCPGSHAHRGWENLTGAIPCGGGGQTRTDCLHALGGSSAGTGEAERHRPVAAHRYRVHAPLAPIREAGLSQRRAVSGQCAVSTLERRAEAARPTQNRVGADDR